MRKDNLTRNPATGAKFTRLPSEAHFSTEEVVHKAPQHETTGVKESTMSTGTTTVGLEVDGGVVLGTDMRASFGSMVSNKTVQKVEQVHPHGAITISGSVSPAQALIRSLQSEVDLYGIRRGEEMSMKALATLVGNFLRSGDYFIVVPILGGIDHKGPQVYSYDAIGGVMQDAYTVSGSGSQFALGLLEQEYERDLSLNKGRIVAMRALLSAMERDVNSGNGINIAEITEEGVDIVRYYDLDDLPL